MSVVTYDLNGRTQVNRSFDSTNDRLNCLDKIGKKIGASVFYMCLEKGK